MRLFIATFLRAPNQARLDCFIGELVDAHPAALRPIPPATAHITHVFCPRVDVQGVANIIRSVSRTATLHKPIEIAIGSPHVIGAPSRPRLVCASLLAGEALLRHLSTDLFENLRHECPALELSPGKAPHVTLARFRKQAERRDGDAVSGWLSRATAQFRLNDAIARIEVVRSTTTPMGPVYERAAHVQLRPAVL